MSASAKLNTAFLDVAVAATWPSRGRCPHSARRGRATCRSFLADRGDEAERLGIVARVFADDSFRADTEAFSRRCCRSRDGAARLKQN